MALLRDSRNTLTDVVQLVSGVTGLPTAPAYLDLRERAKSDPTDDRKYEVKDHTLSPAVMATVALNDPRFWWVMHDLSNVVDPFEVKVGDILLAPALDRLLFKIMKPEDLGVNLTRFYPPIFFMETDGDLARDMLPFVKSFEFKDEHKKPDEVRVVFINDAFRWTDDARMSVGITYRVRWGYPTLWSDVLRVKVQKAIPVFPRNEVPTITMVSWDARMDLNKDVTAVNWGPISSSEVARRLAKKWGLKTDIVESNDARKQDRIQSVRQTDLGYLSKLADDLNYQFDVIGDTLVFKPYNYAANPTLTYTYFTDREGVILDFKPEIKEKQLRKKLGVISTDQRAGAAKREETEVSKPDPLTCSVEGVTEGGKFVSKVSAGSGLAGSTPEPAKNAAKQAQATSDKVNLDADKATLTIVGDPRLRKGKVINLQGFGVRYSGLWYVSSTKHTISNNAMYVTEAKVQRAPLDSKTPAKKADAGVDEAGKPLQQHFVQGRINGGKYEERVVRGAQK